MSLNPGGGGIESVSTFGRLLDVPADLPADLPKPMERQIQVMSDSSTELESSIKPANGCEKE